LNELLVAVLVVIIVFASTAAAVAARRWVFRPVVAQRVVVQLDTDHAITGVLVERRGPLLILADATVHAPDQTAVKADGRSVIERSRVLWIQVI
jgi:hypothetical protein